MGEREQGGEGRGGRLAGRGRGEEQGEGERQVGELRAEGVGHVQPGLVCIP